MKNSTFILFLTCLTVAFDAISQALGRGATDDMFVVIAIFLSASWICRAIEDAESKKDQ